MNERQSRVCARGVLRTCNVRVQRECAHARAHRFSVLDSGRRTAEPRPHFMERNIRYDRLANLKQSSTHRIPCMNLPRDWTSHFKNVLHRALLTRSVTTQSPCRCCGYARENLQHFASCSGWNGFEELRRMTRGFRNSRILQKATNSGFLRYTRGGKYWKGGLTSTCYYGNT